MADTDLSPLRVTAAEMIADGVRQFELRHPDGGALPGFAPGAHIAVRTPNGLLRKYSLCNDPAETDRYVIAVKREAAGGGGSRSMVDELQAGAALPVSAPVNNFALTGSPAGYLFIAGGIGITPIMSMLRHLQGGGLSFRLCYCTRSPDVTAFRHELEGLRGKLTLHHDGGDPARALDLWPQLERPKGHVYCCGPRSLMDAVRDMTGHWSPSAVHFESFTELQEVRPDDRPFAVRLARSGTEVQVPVGTTILQALRAAGRDAPSSCESGSCGTCRTRLLAGQADHRDLVLAPHERNSQIMLCVSRALTDTIEIDL